MSGWGFSLDPVEVPPVETKYRRIVTKLPVPESLGILNDLTRCEARTMHGQMPVVWDRAEGFQVHDAWGNTWIDFTSTIFVANAGHGNRRIIAALRQLLDRPLLHAYNYGTHIRAEYLKNLIEATPPQFEKACLFSAGTEATEAALRLMRMHARRLGKRRPGIIAIEGSFHGETLGARMMGDNPVNKEWIGYHDPNIHHIPFPYPWRAEAMRDPGGYFRASIADLEKQQNLNLKQDICGFMLETFQGWGAVFYPVEYMRALEASARKIGALIAFDEMQAGFGRTGKLFGYMHYGIEPDLLCCGKGTSSSVPLSLILGRADILDLPDFGDMYSTHSANPMACAAGLANLQALLEDGLLDNSRAMGEVLLAELNQLKGRFPEHIGYVLGKGLLAAVHFVGPRGEPLPALCRRVCEGAMHRGLLTVFTGRESLKLAPPLCIHEEALREGVAVLGESIEAALASGTRGS